MIKENGMNNTSKNFDTFYLDNIVYKKDYSILIIDKGAKIEQKFIYYDGTKDTANYITIEPDN